MKSLRIAPLILVAVVANQSRADLHILDGFGIDRLLSDAGTGFGGCMALMDSAGQAVLSSIPGCDNLFVSFGCSGDMPGGPSKSQAAANWASAQLAFVAGKPTYIVIDDNKVFSPGTNYCTAVRIDVLQGP